MHEPSQVAKDDAEQHRLVYALLQQRVASDGSLRYTGTVQTIGDDCEECKLGEELDTPFSSKNSSDVQPHFQHRLSILLMSVENDGRGQKS